jgi:hypothetical protein
MANILDHTATSLIEALFPNNPRYCFIHYIDRIDIKLGLINYPSKLIILEPQNYSGHLIIWLAYYKIFRANTITDLSHKFLQVHV